MRKFKTPSLGTFCEVCRYLYGEPANGLICTYRDKDDTAWVYECKLGRDEFYEKGDDCPSYEYRGPYEDYDYDV